MKNFAVCTFGTQRRLRLQAERRGVRRRDRDQAARRQVAARLLPARVEERLVLDDRPADVGRAGVDLRRRQHRRRPAASPQVDGDAGAAEEERKRAERIAAEQIARPRP